MPMTQQTLLTLLWNLIPLYTRNAGHTAYYQVPASALLFTLAIRIC
jgi:hypothetical protein